MRRFDRYPFNSLLWRFTLSYVAASLLAVIVLELTGLAYSLNQQLEYIKTNGLLRDVETAASWFVVPLQATSPDIATVRKLMLEPVSDLVTFIELGPAKLQVLTRENQWLTSVVTDPDGKILVGDPDLRWPEGRDLRELLTPDEKPIVAQALQGHSSGLILSNGLMQFVSIAAAPVKCANGKKVGMLYARLELPLLGMAAAVFKILLLPVTLIIGLGAVLIGLIYGALFSRRFTRRFKTFSDTTMSWSKGDFRCMIADNSDDELGQLGTRLNQMAVELHDLLLLRQEVATMDERTRMARELHDTVKQKMFAISLQLGAARSLIPKDSVAALLRLNEVEKMAQMVQDDLNALLQELRSPNGRISLAGTLKRMVEKWSWQTGINCGHFVVAPELVPTSVVHELTKVINEALTNTARHSQASSVTMEMTINQDKLILVFTDDGVGFIPAAGNTSGMGLDNMRHRVEALPQGRFELFSQLGYGTSIKIQCGGILSDDGNK